MSDGPTRVSFTAELDQIRIQLELMAVRVDENLERMREVLALGDERLAQRTMSDQAVDQYRRALEAWSSRRLELAEELASSGQMMEATNEALMRELLGLTGPDAVPCALRTLVAGTALDRIADHATVIGARLCYLITGDPDHLASEIR